MSEEVEKSIEMTAFKMLMCLNVIRGRNIYLGTVSRKEKARRRARGKMQKASRKANR